MRTLTFLATFCAAYPFMHVYTGIQLEYRFIPFPWEYRTAPLLALLISATVWRFVPGARSEAVAFTLGMWALSAMIVWATGTF
ncbi:hypothetical protein FB390_2276 [Nocardia bhagyanarayanae]|uniref:Uncharacterized protein n=1 Tax=Nocardia bhagyanarayanae TaxID=1215925 RepID=A0A543F9Y2_9NOCA|nr:hypothetical protein FB390_2276 [Nocardia bhagyanarayanae]